MIINFRTFSFRNENHASQWPKEAVWWRFSAGFA